MIRKILTAILLLPTLLYAQINTERVMTIARNALYFEDYVGNNRIASNIFFIILSYKCL